MTSHPFPSIARLLLVALAMQLLVACTSGDRMRRDLAALEARNQSDSLLTDSTLALSLADYFTTHGTQAERLEAHYLLARTWADLGQAPRALDAFHTAAEQADTTRLDSASCHFLSRIYGQMGGLLDDEVIPWDAIAALNKASCYALLEKDTLSAIIFDEQKVRPYHDLQYYDSVLTVCERAMRSYQHYGETSRYVYAMSSKIYAFLQTKRYDSISPILNRYVSLAHAEDMTDGYFHSLLARYYQGINSYDSAIHHYHIQLALTSVIAGKAVPYRGLSQCYRAMGLSDSANNYNELYCMANDSSVLFKYQSTMQQMHHLYDYSRFQTLADRKTIEASHANQRAVLLAIVIAVLVSLFFFVRKRAVKKLEKVNTDYVNTLILYNKVKDELQSQQNNNAKELQQAESELQRLKEQLATAQQDKHTPDKWDMNSELLNSYIYLEFHQAAAKGKTMPTEKWEQLRRIVNTKMHRFMEAISTLDYSPDLFETQLILLIKLRFLISEIAVLLDVPTYTLTKRRKRLLKLMFKTDGTADEFDRRISVLGIDETDAF